MTLPAPGLERYAAQLALPGWGAAAQERLAAASASVVGAGSAGALAAAHLASAGLGRIGMVDGGRVKVHGLARQTLHFTPEAGASRAESVAAKLGALNPEVLAEPYPVQLERANAGAILTGADVVVECSGDASTRRLVNEACCGLGTAFVVGWAEPLQVFVLAVRPGETACYLCAFPEERERGAGGEHTGALAAIGGLAASLQALEALKLLVGIGAPLLDRVLRVDAGSMEASVGRVARRRACPACAGAGAPQQSP